MRFSSVLFALTFYDAPGRAIITTRITDSDRIFHQGFINPYRVITGLVRMPPGSALRKQLCQAPRKYDGVWQE